MEKRRAGSRRYFAKQTPEWHRARRMKVHHGADHAEAIAAMWREQDGRCYLCHRPLPEGGQWANEQAVIDHDHSCCPRDRSCGFCRRGLACHNCNTLIGLAGDDPDVLRKIADNLEPVLKAVRARIATKPKQDMLPMDGTVQAAP